MANKKIGLCRKIMVTLLASALLLGSENTTGCTIVYAKENKIQEDVPDLKDALTSAFGEEFIAGGAICLSDIPDEDTMALVTKHFNAITFGNELKPDSNFNYSNNQCPGTQEVVLNGETITVPVTNFDRAEKMLEYFYDWNQNHPDDQIKIRGHVLTWHSQTPEWFFHEDYDAGKPYTTPEEMTKRHEWYIKTVLEHFVGPDSKYKDMFYGWDVVNEAVSDGTGTYRNDKENSSWWAVYGNQDFIINAFRFANKYAPASVELYYNDYSECDEKKVEGIAQLLKDVKAAEGTRIDGMGMQGHYHSNYPSDEQFKNAARTYASIVGKVQITELDFQCSKYFDGTDATLEEEHIRTGYRYKSIYDDVQELIAEGVNVSGITVWGIVDKNSWLQHASFVGGGAKGNKRQVPLLFDDNYQVKYAYWALVDQSKLPDPIDDSKVAETEVVEKAVYEPQTAIPKGTIEVDGNLEDTWYQTPALTLSVRNGAKCNATVRLMWDDDYLYAFYSVEDSKLNDDNGNAYEQDSIELFIDERNHKSDTYRDDDKQYRVNFNNVQTFNGQKCNEDLIHSMTKVTKKGYDVELAVAWTNLKPGYGKLIGLDLQINDADKSGNRIGTLNWYDSTGTGYQDPSVLGTAVLKKEVDVEEISQTESTIINDSVKDTTDKLSLWEKIRNAIVSLFQ